MELPLSFIEELKNATLSRLSPMSRVWIYQSNRAFTDVESSALKYELQNFVGDWTAHSQTLYATGDILFNHFVILAVDEMRQGATGCSIDTSIHFIKHLEKENDVKLFDRMLFSYWDKETVHTIPSKELSELYKNKIINDNTLMFDNLVPDLNSLQTNWLKPLGDSWHKKFVKQ